MSVCFAISGVLVNGDRRRNQVKIIRYGKVVKFGTMGLIGNDNGEKRESATNTSVVSVGQQNVS